MSRRSLLATGVLLLLVRGTAAQQHATVQLPTFRQFSLTTSLLVPDQGTAYVGGVSHAFQHRDALAAPLLPRQAYSFERGVAAGAVSVSTVVHDLAALDAAVLSRWQKEPSVAVVSSESKPTRRLTPVSIVRGQVEAKEAEARAQATADLAAARRWEQRGNDVLAKNYYQRALRNATSDTWRAHIRSRLEAIELRMQRDR